MGLAFADLRNLLEHAAALRGARILMLGRQTVYLHRSELKQLADLDQASSAGRWCETYQRGEYAERFFIEVMGASSVDSLDFSDYEGATVIHDLNEPLTFDLIEAFDMVIDGGTLEHVFNFPAALTNFIRLARVGGLLYTQGPCNNLCGHGFYQYSPELIYRAFSPANGLKTLMVRLAVARRKVVDLTTTRYSVYEVADPECMGERVNLINSRPVMIMAMAQRISSIDPFKERMFQSSYVGLWRDDRVAPATGKAKILVRKYLPGSIVTILRTMYQTSKANLRYRRFYKKLW
jgi:hypothetical protein